DGGLRRWRSVAGAVHRRSRVPARHRRARHNHGSCPMTDLFSPTSHGSAHVRAGIGGWTYAPWRDNFYPAKLVQRRELEYASRHLRAIEINGTYYGAQKPATYAKWAAETPSGFVFSLKAPRYVTVGGKLATAVKSARGFIDGGLA